MLNTNGVACQINQHAKVILEAVYKAELRVDVEKDLVCN